MNTDQRKYGSVITALHSQKALQNDQYSRTIIKANNVLSTHNYIKQGSNNTSDSNRTDNANEKEAESAEKNNEDESPVLSFA